MAKYDLPESLLADFEDVFKVPADKFRLDEICSIYGLEKIEAALDALRHRKRRKKVRSAYGLLCFMARYGIWR